MHDLDFVVVEGNGIRLKLAMAGDGPLVIFSHGWPESWYSWRHQIPVIAGAGYRAVAYDVRGTEDQKNPIRLKRTRSKNWQQMSSVLLMHWDTMRLFFSDTTGVVRSR